MPTQYKIEYDHRAEAYLMSANGGLVGIINPIGSAGRPTYYSDGRLIANITSNSVPWDTENIHVRENGYYGFANGDTVQYELLNGDTLHFRQISASSAVGMGTPLSCMPLPYVTAAATPLVGAGTYTVSGTSASHHHHVAYHDPRGVYGTVDTSSIGTSGIGTTTSVGHVPVPMTVSVEGYDLHVPIGFHPWRDHPEDDDSETPWRYERIRVTRNDWPEEKITHLPPTPDEVEWLAVELKNPEGLYWSAA